MTKTQTPTIPDRKTLSNNTGSLNIDYVATAQQYCTTIRKLIADTNKLSPAPKKLPEALLQLLMPFSDYEEEMPINIIGADEDLMIMDFVE